MPSLFSLFVDLKANTADFISGMSTASYAAKKAGRDIEDSFSSLGSIATAALAPFGELGATIGETLSRIGEYAGRASDELAHLGGGMSQLAVVGGLAAGAMAAVGATAIGIAVETAKSADEMFHLAESSGLSVEALSALSFVAKQYDIDQESLTRGLQMMSVQMEKAATKGPNVVSVFDRMGLSVRDSNGQLKDANEMFTEIIDKLDQMKDRTAAVGLAREMFGRQTGAAVLRIDPEGLEHWKQVARELGIVITDEMGDAAHQFETTLNTISAGAEGVKLELMNELLPSLQTVVNFLRDGLQDPGSGLREFIHDLGVGAQAALAFGATLALAWREVGLEIRSAGGAELNFAADSAKIVAGLATGDVGLIKNSWHDLFSDLKGSEQLYVADSKNIWSGYAKFVSGVFQEIPEHNPIAPKKRKKSGGANLGATGEIGIPPTDTIADLVSKLDQESASELRLADAIGQSVSALMLAKAAGEAEVKIGEARAQQLDKEKILRAELANAIKEQHPGDVARYQQEIADVDKYLAELDRATPLIRQRYDEIAVSKLFSSTGQELGKESTKFDQQIASLNQLVAAYKQGGSAIAAAEISKQLEDASQKAKDLAQTEAQFAAAHPFDFSAILVYANAVSNAEKELRKLTAQSGQLKDLAITLDIEKQTQSLRGEAAAYEVLSAAAFSSAAAQREAAAQAAVAKFSAEHPEASEPQKQAVYQNALEQQKQQYAQTILQTAQENDLNYQYDQRITKLNAAKEVLQSYGQSTLAINAAIDAATTNNIEQWDKAAFAVGSFGERFHALFNEIQQQGDNLGEKVFSTMSKSIDDISGQLAKLVVTGKSSFRQMFEGLAEEIAKAQFEKLFAGLAQPLTGGAPGVQSSQVGPGGTPGTFQGPLGIGSTLAAVAGVAKGSAGAADGTQGHPFYVIPSDAQGNFLGKTVGSTSVIGSLFHKQEGSQADNPLFTPALYGDQDSSGSSGTASVGSDLTKSFSSIFSSLGSSIGSLGKSFGSIFGSIGGLFGGFLAGGGDVTPGKAYVVGEKHPEFFVPRQHGSVVPSLRVGGGGHTINMGGFHVHGVTDSDSWSRSSSQIMARLHHEMSVASSRNG